MDGPKKTTARVAPYLDAIRQARTGGWGWREIAARVAPGATADAVRAAVKTCRYAVEQMPLPEAVSMSTTARAAMPESVATPGTATGTVTRRPLRRIDDPVEKPESEMTAAERLIARIPHI